MNLPLMELMNISRIKDQHLRDSRIHNWYGKWFMEYRGYFELDKEAYTCHEDGIEHIEYDASMQLLSSVAKQVNIVKQIEDDNGKKYEHVDHFRTSITVLRRE